MVKIIIKIGLWVGAAMTFAAGVSPQDATTNITAWLNLIGISSIPKWMQTDLANNSVFIIGILLLLSSAGAWFYFKYFKSEYFAEWVSIDEAISYIHKHLSKIKDIEYDSGVIFMDSLDEIRQAGYSGSLKIRGNKEINRDSHLDRFDRLKTKVEPEYWERMEIDPICVDTRAKSLPHTRPAKDGDLISQSLPRYINLEANREDMIRRWN